MPQGEYLDHDDDGNVGIDALDRMTILFVNVIFEPGSIENCTLLVLALLVAYRVVSMLLVIIENIFGITFYDLIFNYVLYKVLKYFNLY